MTRREGLKGVRRNLGCAILAMAVASCLSPYAVLAQSTEAQATYDIPAGDLASAIDALSRQSGLQILYKPDLAVGKRSNPVVGAVTALDALNKMLVGTNLAWERANERTYVLRRAARNSTPARTPKQGRVDSATQDAQELGRIEVTGSRLRRTDVEGTSPVINITREDIDRSGAATVREVLNALPQNSVAMDESGISTLGGSSTVQLRGLSIGSTLILINGRRASSYNDTFFDLNSIPLEAINNIEVLTDTASAIYGADAVGGAVNFILKNDYNGQVVSARLGMSSEGDARERGASFTVGSSGESISALLVIDAYKRDPLFGRDRDLTRSFDFRRFGGPDYRSTAAYPANIYSLSGNLPGLDNNFASVPSGNGVGLSPASFAETDGVLSLFDGAVYSTLMAETQRLGVFSKLSYELTPNTHVYLEALGSINDQIVFYQPPAVSVVVPASNPFNPFGVSVLANYRFTELGPTLYDASNKYHRILSGMSGITKNGYDWDINVMYDRSRQDVITRNAIRAYDPIAAATIQSYLDSTDPAVALNLFSTTGNNNPETLAAISENLTTVNDMHALSAEATLRGSLVTLASGDLQVAIGLTSRRDSGSFRSTGTELDTRTTSSAVFAEMSVPLASPSQNLKGIYSAELKVASRRDWFDSFGARTTSQVGVLWRPVESLAVRGSYGQAFKAPSTSDLFLTYPDAMVFGYPDPLRNDEPAEFIVMSGGNQNLEPEDATSLTLGLVWEPTFVKGLSVGASAFRIRHNNFIARYIDYYTILANPDVFAGRVVRNSPTPEDVSSDLPGTIISLDATTANFGGVEVNGVDIDFRYSFPATRAGDFLVSGLGSLIDYYEVELAPGEAPRNEVGIANYSGYPPRFKGVGQLSWSGKHGFGASLAARHTGSFRDFQPSEDGAYGRLPSTTLYDLQIGYEGGDDAGLGLSGWSFNLGVLNLRNYQGTYSNSGGLPYNPQQIDMRGRYIYVNVKKSF